MWIEPLQELNLWAAWAGIAVGMLGGAAAGLAFHREQWLGGYASWRRRLVRLGHISFFGLAFVNLVFVLTMDRLSGLPAAEFTAASWLLVAGAVTMPLVCFAAAWRPACRHAFFIPVGCLLVGVALVLKGMAL